MIDNVLVKGTCSLCGGRVTLPGIWMGINPPAATCEQCGAAEAQHGPVIQMQPRRAYTQTTTWSQNTANLRQFQSWVYCEHANESSRGKCSCNDNCACREEMCPR